MKQAVEILSCIPVKQAVEILSCIPVKQAIEICLAVLWPNGANCPVFQ